MKNLLLATNSPPQSDPYRPDPQYNVEYVERKRGQYRILHRINTPYIYFEVPRNVSVLQPFYDPCSVKDDSTLKAEITRHENKWMLRVHGELDKCPGVYYKSLFHKLF